MFPRLLIPTVVFAAVALVAPLAVAGEPQQHLERRTVQVADLVVPIINDPNSMCQIEGTKPHPEECLIAFIQREVQPATWNDKGGSGTIQYFAPTMSLVINQTTDIQEQVQDLLSSLRALQETQVALEVRLVTVAEDVFADCRDDKSQLRRLQEVADKKRGMAVLNDKSFVSLLNDVAEDRRTCVSTLPKLTLVTGQAVSFHFDADYEGTSPSKALFQLRARPIVSADRRFVRLELALDGHKLVGQKVVIPDGRTIVAGGFSRLVEVRKETGVPVLGDLPCVGGLFRNVNIVKEPRRVFVLVTPRIIVPQEEEERQTGVVRPAVGIIEEAPAPKMSKVLDELLQAYDAACQAGRTEEADKLGRAALILDPTCFRRK